MITSERMLEDYIAEDKTFAEFIEKEHDLQNVEFVGRQTHIGDTNIADLIYKGETTDPEEVREDVIVVVELKFRTLEPKDFSQLGRYMNAIELVDKHGRFDIRGVLVGTGMSREVAVMINADVVDNDNIKVCLVEDSISYSHATTWWNDAVDCNGEIDDILLGLCIGVKNE